MNRFFAVSVLLVVGLVGQSVYAELAEVIDSSSGFRRNEFEVEELDGRHGDLFRDELFDRHHHRHHHDGLLEERLDEGLFDRHHRHHHDGLLEERLDEGLFDRHHHRHHHDDHFLDEGRFHEGRFHEGRFHDDLFRDSLHEDRIEDIHEDREEHLHHHDHEHLHDHEHREFHDDRELEIRDRHRHAHIGGEGKVFVTRQRPLFFRTRPRFVHVHASHPIRVNSPPSFYHRRGLVSFRPVIINHRLAPLVVKQKIVKLSRPVHKKFFVEQFTRKEFPVGEQIIEKTLSKPVVEGRVETDRIDLGEHFGRDERLELLGGRGLERGLERGLFEHGREFDREHVERRFDEHLESDRFDEDLFGGRHHHDSRRFDDEEFRSSSNLEIDENIEESRGGLRGRFYKK